MTNKAQLRLGLIGAGRIGQIHGANAAHAVTGAELVHVADVSKAAAEALAARLGVARVDTNPAAVIDNPEVDAVLICSATETHAPLIEAAARAGKHVFCEKPVALSLEVIDRLSEEVDRAGVFVQVGFNRRFDPSFAHVQSKVAAKELGEVHIVRITSRDPEPPPIDYVKGSGGLFMDMMIHDFDMARFVVGREVRSVYAVGACRVDPQIGQVGDVDTAVVTLRFEDGALCTIDNSRRAVYGYDQRLEVFGTKGMLWADNRTAHSAGQADATGLHGPRPRDFFLERYREAYVIELQSFVDAVRSGRSPAVGLADGRAPVVLALAAQKSMAEGRAVRLSEVDG